jgi:hyperpolarization activated cyclic nucleotide-gated potassium channel 2
MSGSPERTSGEEHGVFDSIDEDAPMRTIHRERSLRRQISGTGSDGSDVGSSPSQSMRGKSVFERHAHRKTMDHNRARERYEMNQWGNKHSVDVKINANVIDEEDPALKLSDDASMNQALSKWNKVRNMISSKSTINLLRSDSSISKEAMLFGKDVDSEAMKDPRSEPEPVGRWWYINPDGTFRSWWDIFQVVVLCYLACATPYRVAFDHPAYGPAFWWEFFIDFYFILDVFTNFVTGYWEELETTSVLVSEPWPIAVNYIKTWFPIDAVACAPVDLVTRALEGTLSCSFHPSGCSSAQRFNASVDANALKLFKLLRIFRLVKLLRLFRVGRLLHRYQNQLIYYHSFISVARVNGLVILLAHWMGCIYGMNYEDNLDYNSGNRWLQSIYWAVQSITSVGYGDMPADNEITMVIAIFTMLMGVVLCSWIMTNVLAAMNPDSSSKRFHERLQYVIAYLKNNQLPNGVAKRVITFYRWQNMNQFDEKSVLSDLPPSLRKDIFDNLYTDALVGVPIFKSMSNQFITEVCLRMSPISFPQFHSVYGQGELGYDMYFITKGSVAVLLNEMPHNPSTEELQTMVDDVIGLGKGSFFGEPAVLGFASRLETIVCTQSCTMMTLSEGHMEELCQLSYEFKAELTVIACERMIRNRVPKEVCVWCLRDFGLGDDGIIMGEEQIPSASVFSESEKRFNGRTTRVTFHPHWKETIATRVSNEGIASSGKMFDQLKSLHEIVARMEKSGAGSSGSSGGDSSGGSLEKRMDSLEAKLDKLIELQLAK